MATTLLTPNGGVVCPEKLPPHPTTVLSALKPRLKKPPLAMATALVKFKGGETCPLSLFPQPTNRPSLLRAKPKASAGPTIVSPIPAATLTTLLKPSGGEPA